MKIYSIILAATALFATSPAGAAALPRLHSHHAKVAAPTTFWVQGKPKHSHNHHLAHRQAVHKKHVAHASSHKKVKIAKAN